MKKFTTFYALTVFIFPEYKHHYATNITSTSTTYCSRLLYILHFLQTKGFALVQSQLSHMPPAKLRYIKTQFLQRPPIGIPWYHFLNPLESPLTHSQWFSSRSSFRPIQRISEYQNPLCFISFQIKSFSFLDLIVARCPPHTTHLSSASWHNIDL